MLASSYFGWMLVLWTIGNNDAIYTRFLYPGYVFLLLAGFAAYARLTGRAQRWGAPCFLSLYGIVLAVQGSDRLATLFTAFWGS